MNAKSAGGVYGGLLGATTHEKMQVTSDTGESFSTEIYRSINLSDDPDLFERLLAGTLHEVDCPFTDTTYELAVPVALHDPARRVFALYLPSSLRWDEIRLRQRLLKELGEDSADTPRYIREFWVVLDPSELAELPEGERTEAEDTDSAQPQEVTNVSSKPSEDLAAAKELARKRAEVEAEARRVEVERDQLDSVRERFDRERDQMDALQARLQAERTELEKLKQALEIERKELSLEQLTAGQQALADESGTAEVAEESTQVVTDDQFIEIVDVDDVTLASAESVVMIDVEKVVVAPIDLDPDVPDKMSDLVSGARESAVKISGDRLLAVAQTTPDFVDRLFAEEPTFFIQLHDMDGYPVVALLLARLDERQQEAENYAWLLDPAPDGDRLILERLRDRTKLRIAFYGPTGKRLRAIELAAPYEANVAWILDRAGDMLASSERTTFQKAQERFGEVQEKLGTMRHNFAADSFADSTTASQLKLAAGIVGYWSQPDTFEYLVANRCFPLEQFRSIQARVVRRAVESGVFVNAPLRQIALDLELAESEAELTEILTANFAEAAISIRSSDLEPADQWENWDALLVLGEELGVPPDPEVVELAEVSLKRAQEAEELAERSEVEVSAAGPTIEEPRDAQSPDESLVIAKRSESTGITYFLPNDAVLDTFDDLATMSRDDLELLLNDANGRLEAAQMLIERFGAAATPTVMERTEEMNAPEVAALAKFLESKAGGLEAELVRCVESGGPSAAYISARALAVVKSTTAIPVLLDTLLDVDRQDDGSRFVEALAAYGDKLLPALTRAIKRDGPQESLVLLLAHLEDSVEGTLSNLSKDRSKNLREAAKLARQRRESKSA